MFSKPYKPRHGRFPGAVIPTGLDATAVAPEIDLATSEPADADAAHSWAWSAPRC